MENASQAILIAGGVLITMIVASIMTITFSRMSETSERFNRQFTAGQTRSFNAEFQQFDGRDNISIQEIVSLVKYVQNYHDKQAEGDSAVRNYTTAYWYVKVWVNTSDGSVSTTEISSDINFSEKNETELISYLNDNNDTYTNTTATGVTELNGTTVFKCVNMTYSNTTGRINSIIFRKK